MPLLEHREDPEHRRSDQSVVEHLKGGPSESLPRHAHEPERDETDVGQGAKGQYLTHIVLGQRYQSAVDNHDRTEGPYDQLGFDRQRDWCQRNDDSQQPVEAKLGDHRSDQRRGVRVSRSVGHRKPSVQRKDSKLDSES